MALMNGLQSVKIFFLITIFALINPYSSLASINGKGIVCSCVDCKLEHIDPSSYINKTIPTEIGFHFKNDRVTIFFISKMGDKIQLSENINISLRKKKSFYTNNNEIQWTYKDNRNIYAYILDRKTLYLKQMNIIKTKTHNLRKCNAFPEKKIFEEMNKLSYGYQTSYYKRSKKNKI